MAFGWAADKPTYSLLSTYNLISLYIFLLTLQYFNSQLLFSFIIFYSLT